MGSRYSRRRDDDKQLKKEFVKLIAAHEKVTSKMYTILDRFFVDDSDDSDGINLATKQILHYKSNDNSANTTVVDSMGSFNGTFSENTNLADVTGKINGALDYKGSNNITCPIDTDLDMTYSSYAIAIWVRWDNTETGATFQRIFNHNSYKSFLEGSSDGRVSFITNDPTDTIYTDGSSWTAGQWYHFVYNWTGTEKSIWVDGVKQADTSANGDNTGAGTCYIGSSSVSQYINGFIDDVRFFNQSLSPEEISFLYNSGNGTENNS